MKKSIICRAVSVLLGAVLCLAASGCKTDAVEPEKALSITRLGFVADYEHPITPGCEVVVFAQANKRLGVEYQWSLSGEWEPVSGNRIKWTVPPEAGEYDVYVTATDGASGQGASEKISISVLDESVLAEPANFSCRVNTKTTLSNRFIGNIDDHSSTLITKRRDGSVMVESTNSAGEVSRTLSNGNEVYSIDSEGEKRTLLGADEFSRGMQMISPQLLSISRLSEVTDSLTRNGRSCTFRKKMGKDLYEIEFDTMIGQITKQKSSNEDGTKLSDVKLSYDVTDGFLVPKRIEGKVTYIISDVEYSAYIEQEFMDIRLNFEEEEE